MWACGAWCWGEDSGRGGIEGKAQGHASGTRDAVGPELLDAACARTSAYPAHPGRIAAGLGNLLPSAPPETRFPHAAHCSSCLRQVSKEVAKLREYEQTLLKAYQVGRGAFGAVGSWLAAWG